MEGERCRKGRFAGFSVADSAFDYFTLALKKKNTGAVR